MSVKPLLDLTDNDFQRQFVFSPAKFTGYYGGIRNGKTYGGCYRGLMLSEQFPGNVGLVGRLTYPELRDTTQKVFLDFVRKRNGGSLEPGAYIKRFNQSLNELELYNGSIIKFRYLENPESILSMTLGWFYIDQAEFIPEEVYNHLETRVNLWNKDTIEECKQSYLRIHKQPLPYIPRNLGFITGNPAPGWVHRRYKKGMNSAGKPIVPNPYKLIEASTEANIKNLPEDYLAGLRQTQTDEWIARYLAGSWDTFQGQIYKDFAHHIHVVPKMIIPAHWPRFLGMDPGTVNATAVCFVCVDEEGNCVVYNEHYRVSGIIKEHAQAILAKCVGDSVPRPENNDKAVIVWMDPAIKGDHDPEGRDFKQLYEELGIFGLNANKQVAAGIQKVSLLLHPDPTHPYPAWHPKAGQKGSPRLFFMDGACPATLHEMALYEWEPMPEGKQLNAREVPRKYLDHAMDALRYACMAIFEKANPLEKKKDPSYAEFVHAQMMQRDEGPQSVDDIWD